MQKKSETPTVLRESGKCYAISVPLQNWEVLKFLQEIGVQICEASDGSRINLDKLSKQQLDKLKHKCDEVDVPVEPKYQIE